MEGVQKVEIRVGGRLDEVRAALQKRVADLQRVRGEADVRVRPDRWGSTKYLPELRADGVAILGQMLGNIIYKLYQHIFFVRGI